MKPSEDIAAIKGMKCFLTGEKTGLKFRTFVATIADTTITKVVGKYKGAVAREFTLTDFMVATKTFYAGEVFCFGEDFIITEITVGVGGINIVNLESIVPTPAA